MWGEWASRRCRCCDSALLWVWKRLLWVCGSLVVASSEQVLRAESCCVWEFRRRSYGGLWRFRGIKIILETISWREVLKFFMTVLVTVGVRGGMLFRRCVDRREVQRSVRCQADLTKLLK